MSDAVPQALAVPLSATRVASATEPVGAALATVLERSRMLCMLRYEKELLREGSFLEASRKAGVAFSDEQLAVFRGMWVWVSRARASRDVQSGTFGCKCLSWATNACLALPVLERGERLPTAHLCVSPSSAGLYAWRDRVARETDESTGYVMARAQMIRLAQASTGSKVIDEAMRQA